MYHSMPVSQCRIRCLVVLLIGLFVMVFYLPALPIYCNVPYICTAVSCMYVPQHPTQMYCTYVLHIHSIKKKVVTQTDTNFITLTDDSQGNPRIHHTYKWKQNCVWNVSCGHTGTYHVHSFLLSVLPDM